MMLGLPAPNALIAKRFRLLKILIEPSRWHAVASWWNCETRGKPVSGDFHAGGKATAHSVATTSGRISYVDAGSGPAALFVHGVLLNSHLRRHQHGGLADLRRCTSLRRMHRRSRPIGRPASFQKPSRRPSKCQVQESLSPKSGRTPSSNGCVNTGSRNARPNGSAVEPDGRTVKWHKDITMIETTARDSHRWAGWPGQQNTAENLYSSACDRQPQPSPKPIGFRPMPASAIWVANTVRIVTTTAGGSYARAFSPSVGCLHER
jgi:hypothetical protein